MPTLRYPSVSGPPSARDNKPRALHSDSGLKDKAARSEVPSTPAVTSIPEKKSYLRPRTLSTSQSQPSAHENTLPQHQQHQQQPRSAQRRYIDLSEAVQRTRLAFPFGRHGSTSQPADAGLDRQSNESLKTSSTEASQLSTRTGPGSTSMSESVSSSGTQQDDEKASVRGRTPTGSVNMSADGDAPPSPQTKSVPRGGGYLRVLRKFDRKRSKSKGEQTPTEGTFHFDNGSGAPRPRERARTLSDIMAVANMSKESLPRKQVSDTSLLQDRGHLRTPTLQQEDDYLIVSPAIDRRNRPPHHQYNRSVQSNQSTYSPPSHPSGMVAGPGHENCHGSRGSVSSVSSSLQNHQPTAQHIFSHESVTKKLSNENQYSPPKNQAPSRPSSILSARDKQMNRASSVASTSKLQLPTTGMPSQATQRPTHPKVQRLPHTSRHMAEANAGRERQRRMQDQQVPKPTLPSRNMSQRENNRSPQNDETQSPSLLGMSLSKSRRLPSKAQVRQTPALRSADSNEELSPESSPVKSRTPRLPRLWASRRMTASAAPSQDNPPPPSRPTTNTITRQTSHEDSLGSRAKTPKSPPPPPPSQPSTITPSSNVPTATQSPATHPNPKPNMPPRKPRPPFSIFPSDNTKNRNVLNLSIDTAGVDKTNNPSQPARKTDRDPSLVQKQSDTSIGRRAPTINDPNSLSPLSPKSPLTPSGLTSGSENSKLEERTDPANTSAIKIRTSPPSLRQSQEPSPVDDASREEGPKSPGRSSTYSAGSILLLVNEAFFNAHQKMLREQSMTSSAQLENLKEVLLREMKSILYKPADSVQPPDYYHNPGPSPSSRSQPQSSAHSVSDSSYATCQDVQRPKESEKPDNQQRKMPSPMPEESMSLSPSLSLSPEAQVTDSPTIVLPPPDEDPGGILSLMPRSPSARSDESTTCRINSRRGKPAPLPTPKNSEQSFNQTLLDGDCLHPLDGVSTLTPKHSNERDTRLRTPCISVSPVNGDSSMPPPMFNEARKRRPSVFTFADCVDHSAEDDDAKTNGLAPQASSSGSSSDTPVASISPSSRDV